MVLADRDLCVGKSCWGGRERQRREGGSAKRGAFSAVDPSVGEWGSMSVRGLVAVLLCLWCQHRFSSPLSREQRVGSSAEEH